MFGMFDVVTFLLQGTREGNLLRGGVRKGLGIVRRVSFAKLMIQVGSIHVGLLLSARSSNGLIGEDMLGLQETSNSRALRSFWIARI